MIDPTAASGYYAIRELDDGRELFVFPITYGRARLGIGRGRIVFDDLW